jgi:glycosyltransferase involved in cell wall biosynthesis
VEKSCEACDTAYGEDCPMIKYISAIIKKWPLLFRTLRPIVDYFFNAYNVLRARAAVWRARMVNARFPRMHNAATGESWKVRRIGARAAGRQIVMLVVSDLRVDPRVEREARVLASAGYMVTVICPELSEGAGVTYNIDWGQGVLINYIPPTGSAFMSRKPGYYADLLYFAAVRMKPFAFHAHDLSTAFAALAAARVRGSHLIVDFHEWFSENVHWDPKLSAWSPYPPDWKSDLQKLEARCLVEASATITVCDSIALGMEAELGGKRPNVVRNIPDLHIRPTQNYIPLKQQLGLPESTFVLLWQGGSGPTRLIEPIIEALAHAPECVLVIRGPSLDLFGPEYQALARRIGADKRLLLIPPVPSRDVVAAAHGADAGIWTLPALCRNFTYALPNKIFEYIASGLPVLAAHYPEAKRLLADHDIGLTFDPYDPRSIAAVINQLIEDPALATRFRRNTSAALQRLDAGAEWQKLVTLYDSLPRTG